MAARRYDMELEAALLGAIKSIVNDSGINNCMDVIEELEPYTDLKIIRLHTKYFYMLRHVI